MKYANGENIILGDHIWWDEGLCLGYVVEIVETIADQKKRGLDEPSFFLNPGHPKGMFNDRVIGHPQCCVVDEGIDRLTPEEEIELANCFSIAVKKSPKGDWNDGYTVISLIENCTHKGFSFTLESNKATVSVRLHELAAQQGAARDATKLGP